MDIAEVNPLDATIKETLNQRREILEQKFEADVIFFYGQIQDGAITSYRTLIQGLQGEGSSGKQRLVIFLNTLGGSVETVERFSNINRRFYTEVFFVVPDQAMSAGTVFCLSGEQIYMDYSSALGPIDPQLFNGDAYVPVRGYLDKINEFAEKMKAGTTLNPVEVALLQKMDLAFLGFCEQISNFANDLTKQWLQAYMFKNALKSDAQIKNIVESLGNNQKWLSHGRYINVEKLKEMGLSIVDYTDDKELSQAIHRYNDLVISYIQRHRFTFFLNSKNYF